MTMAAPTKTAAPRMAALLNPISMTAALRETREVTAELAVLPAPLAAEERFEATEEGARVTIENKA